MTNRQNVWVKEALKELRREFGGMCSACHGAENLEFAHIHPTVLRGRGRGRKERYYDIIRHRHAYILLCKSCHTTFDLGGFKALKEIRESLKIEDGTPFLNRV